MHVKKCGLAVMAVMPEENMKFLTNIRKMKERRDRKFAANIEETRSLQSKATTSRSKRMRKAAKSLREDAFGELDDEALTSSERKKRESYDELEIDDDDGQLISQRQRCVLIRMQRVKQVATCPLNSRKAQKRRKT